MNFTFNYDNQKFVANANEIDSIINRLNKFYKYSDKDMASLSMLIIDSKEALEYVLNKITNLDESFIIYNLGKNKTLSLEELNNLISSRKQVCIRGFSEYISYLKNLQIYDKPTESILYANFTLARDNFFVKNKTKVLFILDSKEHQSFIKYGAGHQLFSYCGFSDSINRTFKLIDSDITLDEYLTNQRININSKKEKITIKKIDESQLEEAFNLCFRELVKYTIFSKFESIDEESKQLNLTIATNYHKQNNTLLLGAYHDDDLVGVLEINNNDNYINQIAVVDEFKNQGIGYKLFLESIKDKNEGTEISLNADESAVEKYNRWGFKPIEGTENDSKMTYVIQKKRSYENDTKGFRKRI